MISVLLLMLAGSPAHPTVNDVTGKLFKTTAMRPAPAPRREMTIVIIRPTRPQPEPCSFTVHPAQTHLVPIQ